MFLNDRFNGGVRKQSMLILIFNLPTPWKRQLYLVSNCLGSFLVSGLTSEWMAATKKSGFCNGCSNGLTLNMPSSTAVVLPRIETAAAVRPSTT